MEINKSPDCGKTFFLGNRIVLFSFCNSTASVRNDVVFVVRLPLSEHRTETCGVGIAMDFIRGVRIVVPQYGCLNEQTPQCCKRLIAHLGPRGKAVVTTEEFSQWPMIDVKVRTKRRKYEHSPMKLRRAFIDIGLGNTGTARSFAGSCRMLSFDTTWPRTVDVRAPKRHFLRFS